jgi:hypothetical protein
MRGFEMQIDMLFSKLRGATPDVIPIPDNLNGLPETARLAEFYFNKYRRAFWNTENRNTIASDADYISMVLSVLKTRCGVDGGKDAEQVIKLLEQSNVD